MWLDDTLCLFRACHGLFCLTEVANLSNAPVAEWEQTPAGRLLMKSLPKGMEAVNSSIFISVVGNDVFNNHVKMLRCPHTFGHLVYMCVSRGIWKRYNASLALTLSLFNFNPQLLREDESVNK